MRKFVFPFAMMLAFCFSLMPATVQTASADDFIDLDLTNVAPGARAVFRRAERFWESKIVGYSRNLPRAVRNQITGRLTISAETAIVDGPGGVLGFAGPDQIAGTFFNAGIRNRPLAVQQYAIPITSSMFFDVADAGRADFENTVLHEMGHALGIGTLWSNNGLFDPADPAFRQGLLQTTRTGLQYVGRHGLNGFRTESGHHRANYVPTDQPSLGHWAPDNWFFAPRNQTRTELMTPFATGLPTWVSKASIYSLADVGWDIKGLNEGGGFGNGGTTPGHPSIPGFVKRGFSFQNLTAVPEPTSAALIGLGLMGLFARRKRS